MDLPERIQTAHAAKTPLRIRGGGSKDWYGGPLNGEVLDLSGHCGIISYEPSELVLTAKAGTPLTEIEALLDRHGQMLAFEPPHFSLPSPSGKAVGGEVFDTPHGQATLGGALACAFGGPRRAYAGSARDTVLGMRLLDGRGQALCFGGQVMKNVAGYDVSRLMVGALGTLGVILEASLKVLPKPPAELTLRFELDEADAILKMNQLSGLPLPLSGSAWVGGALMLRLSGAETAVRAAHEKLGGELHEHGADFWQAAREQSAAFFSANDLPLWRLSLPAACPPLALPGRQALTWGGAQRWLKSSAPANVIRSTVAIAGGHATLFRGGDKSVGVFHPLPESLMKYHRRLKAQFDPAGILNRSRFYPDF